MKNDHPHRLVATLLAMAVPLFILSLESGCASRRMVDVGGEPNYSQIAFETTVSVVQRRGLSITSEARSALRDFFGHEAYDSQVLDEERVVDAAGKLGDLLADNASFDTYFGDKAVTQRSVSAALRLICPPPFYPVC